jgi:hypothetical protein
MVEITGDLWTILQDPKRGYGSACILVNWTTNNQGYAIMGRGIAAQAKQLYPDLPDQLGTVIREAERHPYVFTYTSPTGTEPWLIMFPTKLHWRDPSPLWLVKQSVCQLMDLLDQFDWLAPVLLPRPGVGNGKLDWELVKATIAPILDKRVHITSP